MPWQFNNTEAVFLQIADRLRHDIINGIYQPNQQFPSVRQLAAIAAVNPNTMQKALACLEQDGLLHTHGTAGRFVTSDTAVFAAAREKLLRDTVRRWLEQAESLNISTDELINYIKEEAQKS